MSNINPTYKFKFANPIIFRRVYDFKMPNSFANEYWTPLDSDKKEIIRYQTRNTLVCNMALTYYRQEDVFNSYYCVIIRGANTSDGFKIMAYNIDNFLEIFDIM